MKVLVLAGEKCEKVMGRLIVNVPVKDVQCDEIWGYIFKKEGHKTTEEVATDATIGDAYAFVAIERNTKLILNFALGRRDQATTDAFIEGLRLATAPRQSRSLPQRCPGVRQPHLGIRSYAAPRSVARSRG